MKIIRVGVDLAKNVFQVHGVDHNEKPVWQHKLKRDEWIKILLEKIEPGCVIVLAHRKHARPPSCTKPNK